MAMDMDISMDIQAKFHIYGNPGDFSCKLADKCFGCLVYAYDSFQLRPRRMAKVMNNE